jgi:hypothetical protein
VNCHLDILTRNTDKDENLIYLCPVKEPAIHGSGPDPDRCPQFERAR